MAREEGLSNIIYFHPKVGVMSGERAGKHGVPQGSWLYLVPCWSLSQGWQSIPALLGGQYTSYVQGARPIQAREVADGNFRDGKGTVFSKQLGVHTRFCVLASFNGEYFASRRF